jgi:hypothetical protein
MDVIYLDHITRNDVRNNPEYLFIFGDNDDRRGYGGQAKEIRGEMNSYGICVKKTPDMSQNAFYTDDEYEYNVKKITNDINRIMDIVDEFKYKGIVISSAGIGTGFAQLSKRAPKTEAFLNGILLSIGILNGVDY